MARWIYTEALHDALVEAITDEPWELGYKEELIDTLLTIERGAVISDEKGLRDANGDVIELEDDERMPDDHPATLAGYFGLTHLASEPS